MRERLSGFRAAIATGALLLTVCAGLTIFLMWRQDTMLRPEVVSKMGAVGRSVVQQVGLALHYGIPFDAIAGMDDFLAAMAQPNPEVAYMAVTDGGGRILYRLGAPPAVFPPAVPAQVADFRDGILDVAVPLMTEGTVAGSVHIGMAEGMGLAVRLLVVSILAAVAAGGVAVATVLAFTRRTIDVPLGRMREVLAAPSSAQVPTDLLTHGVRGEMRDLAVAAHRMLTDLADHRAAFRQEMEEIAAAQPDAEGRRTIEALADGAIP